jgi:hypothetical protein
MKPLPVGAAVAMGDSEEGENTMCKLGGGGEHNVQTAQCAQ